MCAESRPAPACTHLPCAFRWEGSFLADLARAAARGEAPALNQLLRAVQDPVHHYLCGRLAAAGDCDDQARDLGQEVLLRAAAALPRSRFADDRRLMAWMLTIARRVLIDHVRAERARRAVVAPGDVSALDGRVALDHWRTPMAGRARGDSLAAVVAAALRALPEPTRELLRLRVQLRYTWKEVALALDTTQAGAKRRYQRAQASLRARVRVEVGALPPRERARLPAWAAALAAPTPGGTPTDDDLS
ncbi:RNA polymerase sigma factor [Longimicrobium sp.]|uniref:RNA polymerase sigma factor n=1 Tax=Longimicrobium sp. TaxID=2029185 RepID=UPI003B3B1025